MRSEGSGRWSEESIRKGGLREKVRRDGMAEMKRTWWVMGDRRWVDCGGVFFGMNERRR